MDKYIHDEKNGLWYELQGDYYLRCLPCLYHSSVRRNFTQYSFEGIKGGKTLPGVRKWQSRSLD